MNEDIIRIKDLHLRCVVGVNEWERREKQDVVLNVEIGTEKLKVAGRTDRISDTLDYKKIKYGIIEIVEGSGSSPPYLIEKLAFDVAKFCILHDGVRWVKVEVDKPGALRFARSVSVEIKMSWRDYFISIGANINPEENIKRALKVLAELEEVRPLRMSHFYETPPLNSKGQIDDSQPKFINGVLKISSFLGADELQGVFDDVERKLGRKKTKENKFAPREIDIDVVLSLSDDGKLLFVHDDIFDKFFLVPCIMEVDRRMLFFLSQYLRDGDLKEKFVLFRKFALKLDRFSREVRKIVLQREEDGKSGEK